MKARVWCRKHRRRHSIHAAAHCREGWKPGECPTKSGTARGPACPLKPTLKAGLAALDEAHR